MFTRHLLSVVAMTLSVIMATAQTTLQTEAPLSIVESMGADSSVVVIQPAGLEDRVIFHLKEEIKRVHVDNRAGFRVQIFSDGNQTTARNSARARIRQVSGRFPQYRTYLDYKSPYWRARVGDFRNRDEAEDAASKIRSAFPGFGKEVRVVSDRISILD